VAKARAALPQIRPGTDSPRETVTRLFSVRAGLPCPEVNLRVNTTDGVKYLDLAYGEAKLALEYDGQVHARDGILERDTRRRRALEDLGWRIITITDRDLRADPDSILRSVTAALAERAPHLVLGLKPADGRAIVTQLLNAC